MGNLFVLLFTVLLFILASIIWFNPTPNALGLFFMSHPVALWVSAGLALLGLSGLIFLIWRVHKHNNVAEEISVLIRNVNSLDLDFQGLVTQYLHSNRVRQPMDSLGSADHPLEPELISWRKRANAYLEQLRSVYIYKMKSAKVYEEFPALNGVDSIRMPFILRKHREFHEYEYRKQKGMASIG